MSSPTRPALTPLSHSTKHAQQVFNDLKVLQKFSPVRVASITTKKTTTTTTTDSTPPHTWLLMAHKQQDMQLVIVSDTHTNWSMSQLTTIMKILSHATSHPIHTLRLAVIDTDSTLVYYTFHHGLVNPLISHNHTTTTTGAINNNNTLEDGGSEPTRRPTTD